MEHDLGSKSHHHALRALAVAQVNGVDMKIARQAIEAKEVGGRPNDRVHRCTDSHKGAAEVGAEETGCTRDKDTTPLPARK